MILALEQYKQSTAAMRDKLTEIAGGLHLDDLRRELDLAILLIAHDLSVVRNVCDRVCVMHHGLFEDAGPAEDVFDHPQSDYTKNLLAAVPDVRRSLTARALT